MILRKGEESSQKNTWDEIVRPKEKTPAGQ